MPDLLDPPPTLAPPDAPQYKLLAEFRAASRPAA